VNGNTLGALDASFGHQDFGVYAQVVQSGAISTGCEWRLI
jgi:hypothetical protein